MKFQLNFQIVRVLNYKQRFSDALPLFLFYSCFNELFASRIFCIFFVEIGKFASR